MHGDRSTRIAKEFALNAEQRSASWLGLIGRFRLGSLMWLCVLVAVLLMWRRDRAQLQLQVASLGGHTHIGWSIDHILGPPHASGTGGLGTAWASQRADSGMEWVIVEFPSTVRASGVHVYETLNPGAICRVSSVSMTGAEEILWEGTDPVVVSKTSRRSAPIRILAEGKDSFLVWSLGSGGVSKIPFATPVNTRRLKIYLDSAAVPGWNEVDAVALVDGNSEVQWASSAWASSSFAFNRKAPSWFFP